MGFNFNNTWLLNNIRPGKVDLQLIITACKCWCSNMPCETRTCTNVCRYTKLIYYIINGTLLKVHLCSFGNIFFNLGTEVQNWLHYIPYIVMSPRSHDFLLVVSIFEKMVHTHNTYLTVKPNKSYKGFFICFYINYYIKVTVRPSQKPILPFYSLWISTQNQSIIEVSYWKADFLENLHQQKFFISCYHIF